MVHHNNVFCTDTLTSMKTYMREKKMWSFCFHHQLDIEMTRLGRLAKIHPDIVAFCAEHQTRDLHTVDELTDFYNSKVSCLNASN